MSQGSETFRRLRSAYAEFRSAVATQRTLLATPGTDADQLLAAAVEGDWLSATIAELHADRAIVTASTDAMELVERAACAAEAAHLAKELEALAAEVAIRRDSVATELSALSPQAPGAYQQSAPIMIDARG